VKPFYPSSETVLPFKRHSHRYAKETIPGLQGVRHLLTTIDSWLRVDRDERRVREAKEALEPKKVSKGPVFASRHMAHFR
jgi:CCR4-NOT complex subunit CAF16